MTNYIVVTGAITTVSVRERSSVSGEEYDLYKAMLCSSLRWLYMWHACGVTALHEDALEYSLIDARRRGH